MKSYRRLQKFMALSLIVYLLIGYGFHLLKLRELFPIFSWELFSVVPARERIDFGLLITDIDGRPLPEPLYFEEAPHLFGDAHSIQAYGSIQLFATAVIQKEEAEAARIRRYVESLFLEDVGTVSYHLIRRRADLLSLWEGSEYEEETIIATFEK